MAPNIAAWPPSSLGVSLPPEAKSPRPSASLVQHSHLVVLATSWFSAARPRHRSRLSPLLPRGFSPPSEFYPGHLPSITAFGRFGPFSGPLAGFRSREVSSPSALPSQGQPHHSRACLTRVTLRPRAFSAPRRFTPPLTWPVFFNWLRSWGFTLQRLPRHGSPLPLGSASPPAIL